MNNVPKMISAKDLDYIKDMLNWNHIMCKKVNHYLTHIGDEEVKKALISTMNMHAEHYKYLLNILR